MAAATYVRSVARIAPAGSPYSFSRRSSSMMSLAKPRVEQVIGRLHGAHDKAQEEGGERDDYRHDQPDRVGSLAPSVRFAQPRLEEQPGRAARQNEHQRQTGNAHVFHGGRPSRSARIIPNIWAWTIATRS